MFAPLAGVVGSVQDPLDEDHGDEVTEEEQEEHQLGYELQEYGVILGVVDFVPQTLNESLEFKFAKRCNA